MLVNQLLLSIGAYLLAQAVPASAWNYVPNNQIWAFDHMHVGGAINKFHPFLKVVSSQHMRSSYFRSPSPIPYNSEPSPPLSLQTKRKSDDVYV